MNCRSLAPDHVFCKKLENFEPAASLNFCYFNLIKTHGAIHMTPAHAARVETSAWILAELVESCGE